MMLADPDSHLIYIHWCNSFILINTMDPIFIGMKTSHKSDFVIAVRAQKVI